MIRNCRNGNKEKPPVISSSCTNNRNILQH
jgi:hypothetical protein